ncbi:hypothetical protein LL912_21985 [Niabella sp. CC-SYL272]|uniref:hypothetical protein n=1 Tax=Niabella agricola TaxID=2891571 RepID=UPI001F415A7A|nr:hypothetical protein [Niabella agricola]MCF3111472.1 hypothetical protein [Niabella agricola]
MSETFSGYATDKKYMKLRHRMKMAGRRFYSNRKNRLAAKNQDAASAGIFLKDNIAPLLRLEGTDI